MNQQLKTVLLTVLTLSCFVIALVELSGVSSTALFNKYGIGGNKSSVAKEEDPESINAKMKQMREIPKTIIKFDTTKHSFGTINEGDVVKYTYHFKNIGSNPLLIANAAASCGCTVPSYPKQPVAPGADGNITVEFNSHGKKGHQQKNVMIYSNAQEEAMSIGFDADVKEK
jgi:hypothetical protein